MFIIELITSEIIYYYYNTAIWLIIKISFFNSHFNTGLSVEVCIFVYFFLHFFQYFDLQSYYKYSNNPMALEVDLSFCIVPFQRRIKK